MSCIYNTFTLAKLLNFSGTSAVNEGEYANFSCTIRRGHHTILWKIGAYTDEEGTSHQQLENNNMGVSMYAESVSAGGRETERIGILATPELDGTPVQCVIVPHDDNSNRFTREYSKFSIIRVNLNSNTTTNSNTTINRGSYCSLS